jgi:hypothetical protein
MAGFVQQADYRDALQEEVMVDTTEPGGVEGVSASVVTPHQEPRDMAALSRKALSHSD